MTATDINNDMAVIYFAIKYLAWSVLSSSDSLICLGCLWGARQLWEKMEEDDSTQYVSADCSSPHSK